MPFEIVDAGDGFGGIWDVTRAETPMYRSAHFISSRTVSGFRDFPMPDDYPDYPRHDHILSYVRSYAEAHGLAPNVRFRTRVDRLAPEGDGGWRATLDSGEERRWSAVVVATGTTWHPRLPEVEGAFDGDQIHSFAYGAPEQFVGKRVLVVGGGNSGCDIACDAARNAARAFLSMRRGYHFCPKYVFGQPSDVFAHGGPQLPAWLEERVLGFLVNRVFVGDLRRYGLPRPDHPILRSHPIMNTQVLHHLGHGDLEFRPDVRALRPGSVVFSDGREDEVDLIVWATGYRRHFPFLGPDASPGPGGEDLFLHVLHRRHPTLAFLGLFETDGAAYELFGLQAELVARHLALRQGGGALAERFDRQRIVARPDLRGGRRYVDSPRHSWYVRGETYGRVLRKTLASLR
jgi:cation diffusion facilitator CzcD-associated flavoprotein CzcO